VNKTRLSASFVLLFFVLMGASPAFAQTPTTPALDSGDIAFVLISAALVLRMTIPGLALFYGGMVRTKNIPERSRRASSWPR